MLLKKLNEVLKSKIKKTLLVFLFLPVYFFTRCTEDVKVVEFTNTEVIRLLSGDSTKSWLRVSYKLDGHDHSLGECDLQAISTFYLDDFDSLKYVIRLNPVVCQSISDTLESGYWQIIGKFGKPDIAEKIEFVQNSDTISRDIVQISSLYLTLSGSEGESILETSFEAVIPD
jgi:hypothetical protein